MASAALLVTFRPYVAQVFTHRCNAADITPITCGSLDAGWRALMTVRPDLLILDGGFPYEELQDFSRWYRANPDTKGVPVAALVPPNLRALADMVPLETKWRLHIPLAADDLQKVLIESTGSTIGACRNGSENVCVLESAACRQSGVYPLLVRRDAFCLADIFRQLVASQPIQCPTHSDKANLVAWRR